MHASEAKMTTFKKPALPCAPFCDQRELLQLALSGAFTIECALEHLFDHLERSA